MAKKVKFQVGVYRRTGDPEEPDSFEHDDFYASFKTATSRAAELSLTTGKTAHIYAVRVDLKRGDDLVVGEFTLTMKRVNY